MVSSVLGPTIISPERSARIVTDRCVGGVGDQKDRNLVPRQLGWLMFELLYIQSEPLTTFSGSPVQARSLDSGKWKQSRFQHSRQQRNAKMSANFETKITFVRISSRAELFFLTEATMSRHVAERNFIRVARDPNACFRFCKRARGSDCNRHLRGIPAQ